MMAKFVHFLCSINLLFIICTLPVNCMPPRVRVQTKLGEFIGRYVTVEDKGANRVIEVKQFLSVPFAKPPLDEFRFRVAENYTELPNRFLKCSKMPKACYQYTKSNFPWALPHTTEAPYIDEDCLYMNIWVPVGACKQDKKPIFFWIHGGGFTSGSIRQEIYNGKVLAALGDVIVVTTNYRLGFWGFWNARRWHVPGNVGIWDVIQSLTWVRDNIEDFGGDKDSVTIAGQDAGAVIVSMLAITPFAEGLFKRQIVMSGSAMWVLANEYLPQESLNLEIAGLLGCTGNLTNTEDVADCLRENVFDLDTIKYLDKSLPLKYRLIHEDVYSSSFLPIYREYLFPQNPRETLLKGGFKFKELLIGNTANEGTFLITAGMPDYFGFYGKRVPKDELKVTLARQMLNDFFRTYKQYSNTAFLNHEKLEQFLSEIIAHEDVDFRLLMADAIGGFLMSCPTTYYAAVSARSGVKVYYYDFKYRSSKSIWAKWMTPTHFDEVRYIFGHPIISPDAFPPEDVRLSRMMLKQWTDFVKYGKPDYNWPLYGNRSERVVYISDEQPEIACGPHGYHCKLWWDYIYHNETYILPDYKGFPEYLYEFDDIIN